MAIKSGNINGGNNSGWSFGSAPVSATVTIKNITVTPPKGTAVAVLAINVNVYGLTATSSTGSITTKKDSIGSGSIPNVTVSQILSGVISGGVNILAGISAKVAAVAATGYAGPLQFDHNIDGQNNSGWSFTRVPSAGNVLLGNKSTSSIGSINVLQNVNVNLLSNTATGIVNSFYLGPAAAVNLTGNTIITSGYVIEPSTLSAIANSSLIANSITTSINAPTFSQAKSINLSSNTISSSIGNITASNIQVAITGNTINIVTGNINTNILSTIVNSKIVPGIVHTGIGNIGITSVSATVAIQTTAFFLGQSNYIDTLNDMFNAWASNTTSSLGTINITGGTINDTVLGDLIPSISTFSLVRIKPINSTILTATAPTSINSLQYLASNGSSVFSMGVNGAVDLIGPEYLAYEAFINCNNGIGISANGINTHLHINTVGNIGIKYNPSAWDLYLGLDVSTYSSLYSSDTEIGINSNSFYTTAWQYKTSGNVSKYSQNTGGSHQWNSSTSSNILAGFSTPTMTLSSSGNLLLNTNSTTPIKGVAISQNTDQASLNIGHTSATNIEYLSFIYSTNIGSIKQLGTNSVQYLTTSDGRLKYNQKAITAIESSVFIDSLIPKKWVWANGGSDCGFIAHEAQLVAKNSVTGYANEVDLDNKPIYQSMQAGSPEIIAHMLAELQFLRKRIRTLEV